MDTRGRPARARQKLAAAGGDSPGIRGPSACDGPMSSIFAPVRAARLTNAAWHPTPMSEANRAVTTAKAPTAAASANMSSMKIAR